MEFFTQFLAHFTDLGRHAIFIWLSWGAVVIALTALALISRAAVSQKAKEVDRMRAEMRDLTGDEI